jgi:hypothetical protein
MSGFGGGKSSYGGKGIKFSPTLRLQTTLVKQLKVREVKRGQMSQIEVIKSDYNSCRDRFEVEIMWGKGIILSEEDFKMGQHAGILEKHGRSGYKFMGGKLQWGSKPELYDLYDKNNKLLDLLKNKLIKVAHDNVLKNRHISDDDTEENE